MALTDNDFEKGQANGVRASLAIARATADAVGSPFLADPTDGSESL
jgi:hypothetical protein